MSIDFSIREAVPGDAPDFASSQILAWRAAYAGILDAGYLAGMDVERLTEGWERILGNPDRSVRRLAVTVDGTAVGWSGFAIRFYEKHGWCPDGRTRQDVRFDPPLLERRLAVSLR